jgi:O-antigen biosynthesis protein WbqV
MIRLAGLRPEVDIEIAFTGLRPGEKMHERLFHEAEPPVPTAADGILLAQPRFMTLGALMPPLDHLLEAAERRAKEDVALALRALVPEFGPSAVREALAPAESS